MSNSLINQESRAGSSPTKARKLAGSFRDPDGFLFTRGDVLYRQVNQSCRESYDHFMKSGLYEAVVRKGLLVSHEEVSNEKPCVEDRSYRIIKPQLVPFISYPYEWCFSALSDAALCTLEIQMLALEHGMSLKDCSAYNVQFFNGRPIHIDTLSFERWTVGRPWPAYRQFCQHFLAPLALMSYVDLQLSQLTRVEIDGIKLQLAVKLLPGRTKLNLSLLPHLHLHAKFQSGYADAGTSKRAVHRQQVSKRGLLGLVDNLQSAVRKLKPPKQKTVWGEYYSSTNYTLAAENSKKGIVKEFLRTVQPQSVLDLGANTGVYSRLASDMRIPTIACDMDPAAVDQNYLMVRGNNEQHLLPLVVDLCNPSPAIGWQNTERQSFLERAQPDLAMMLAVIHHLAIGNNLPFENIIHLLKSTAPWAIVEFVAKDDSQVQRLLASREDIFPNYTPEAFEASLRPHFNIVKSVPIEDSRRLLYLLKRKEAL